MPLPLIATPCPNTSTAFRPSDFNCRAKQHPPQMIFHGLNRGCRYGRLSVFKTNCGNDGSMIHHAARAISPAVVQPTHCAFRKRLTQSLMRAGIRQNVPVNPNTKPIADRVQQLNVANITRQLFQDGLYRFGCFGPGIYQPLTSKKVLNLFKTILGHQPPLLIFITFTNFKLTGPM